MRAARVPLSLSLAAGLLCAQATAPTRQQRPAPSANPQPDSTPSKKPGSIEGVVTNSVTGGPVKKATVSLRNVTQRFSYSGVTDGAGHFLVENVEPGTYQAMPGGDGFMADLSRGIANSIKVISVAEEQHVKDVALKLLPLGLVSGRVLDEDGDPIAGASIQAMRYLYTQARKQLTAWGYANSNDLGEFQIMDLQPGRYYFQVVARSQLGNIAGRLQGVEEIYPATYYPNAQELAQAKAVEITAGAQINNIDFRLRKVRSYGVRGRVVDENGQPARGAQVQLLPPENNAPPFFRPGAPVQNDGRFSIRGVASGSYWAISQRQGGADTASARQAISVSDQDVEDLVIALVPSLEISGAIQVDGPETAPPPAPSGQSVPQPRLRVMLQPLDRIGQSPQASVENDGTFQLHNVQPNVYQLRIFGTPTGKYLKSVRLGEREAPNGEIDLRQQGAGQIHLTFGTDGGQIQGSVQSKNGDPAAGVTITIAPGEDHEDRMDLFKQSFTDGSGNFRALDIAPGAYKVYAWEQFDSMTMRSPEFLKALESRAVTVSIGANSKESVQLKTISSEDVEAEKSKLP